MQNFHSDSIFLIHIQEKTTCVKWESGCPDAGCHSNDVWQFDVCTSQVVVGSERLSAAFWIASVIVNHPVFFPSGDLDRDKMIERCFDLITRSIPWVFLLIMRGSIFVGLPTKSPHNLYLLGIYLGVEQRIVWNSVECNSSSWYFIFFFWKIKICFSSNE